MHFFIKVIYKFTVLYDKIGINFLKDVNEDLATDRNGKGIKEYLLESSFESFHENFMHAITKSWYIRSTFTRSCRYESGHEIMYFHVMKLLGLYETMHDCPFSLILFWIWFSLMCMSTIFLSAWMNERMEGCAQHHKPWTTL